MVTAEVSPAASLLLLVLGFEIYFDFFDPRSMYILFCPLFCGFANESFPISICTLAWLLMPLFNTIESTRV